MSVFNLDHVVYRQLFVMTLFSNIGFQKKDEHRNGFYKVCFWVPIRTVVKPVTNVVYSIVLARVSYSVKLVCRLSSVNFAHFRSPLKLCGQF